MADSNSVSTTALVAIAVLPALATAALTAVVTALSERRAERREHSHWIRRERLERYTELTMLMADFISKHRRNSDSPDFKEDALRMEQARHRALMVSDRNASSHIQVETSRYWKALSSPAGTGAGHEIGAVSNLRYELVPYIIQPSVKDSGYSHEYIKGDDV